MDKFYYFNDNNIRYTIGTYYKDGFVINSSSSQEKGFIYYVDSIRHVATTSKFNNMHIPADTRSAFPVISVHSPVSIQCRWQS